MPRTLVRHSRIDDGWEAVRCHWVGALKMFQKLLRRKQHEWSKLSHRITFTKTPAQQPCVNGREGIGNILIRSRNRLECCLLIFITQTRNAREGFRCDLICMKGSSRRLHVGCLSIDSCEKRSIKVVVEQLTAKRPLWKTNPSGKLAWNPNNLVKLSLNEARCRVINERN